MEIYEKQPPAASVPTPASHAASVHGSGGAANESAGYWKFCSAVLGVALLIAVFGRTTPAGAHASDSGFTIPEGWIPVEISGPETLLRVGGFDMVDDRPVFVLVNEFGERVGMMEMESVPGE